LIGIGVIVSIYPKLSNASTFESNAFWLLMFISSRIPAAFSSVYQEKILKFEGDMDIWYFSGVVALYQLIVGFGTFWTVFINLPAPSKHVSISKFPDYMMDATACLLGYSSTNSDSNCEFSWAIFGVFLLFNITFNVLITFVMKRGSATLAVIASTTTLALTSLGYHIPILAGEAKVESITSYSIISLFIIIIAIFVYKIRDEIRDEIPSEDLPMPPILLEDIKQKLKKKKKVTFSENVLVKSIDTSGDSEGTSEHTIFLQNDQSE